MSRAASSAVATAAVATGANGDQVEAKLKANPATAHLCNTPYDSYCGEDIDANLKTVALCPKHATVIGIRHHGAYPRHEAPSGKGRLISTCRFAEPKFCAQKPGHAGSCSGVTSPFK